jgi:hypothetical protein
MKDDASCPYCGKAQEINHDDGYGFEEDRKHEQQCGFCGKYFTYTTSIHYYYETFKADCLNGSEHKFKPTMTFPKEYTRMQCTDCEEERMPTAEEKIKYNIPEIEGKK